MESCRTAAGRPSGSSPSHDETSDSRGEWGSGCLSCSDSLLAAGDLRKRPAHDPRKPGPIEFIEMEKSNFLLWLCTVAFGGYLAYVLRAFYAPALRWQAPPAPAAPPPAAWFICEEGGPIDRDEIGIFPLRTGGVTRFLNAPGRPDAETLPVYLSSEGIEPEHACVNWDPAAQRYRLASPKGAPVKHNNQMLAPGESHLLSDGDKIELGELVRFRFTLTDPSKI